MALDLSGLTQDEQIAQAAAYAGVPESIVRGQWRVESSNGTARNKDGVIRSSAGARGDFQIIPSTQAVWEQRNGRTYDVDNFQSSLELYGDIMRENMQLAKGDVTTALRIYHGGTNRRNWGEANAAYAPAVLGGEAAPTASNVLSHAGGDMQAAWDGAGNMTDTTWKGASIPAAWRGDPINAMSENEMARGSKQYVGKVRKGIATLALGQNVDEGGDTARGVALSQGVIASDTIVPWWTSQEVEDFDPAQRSGLLQESIDSTARDRAEAEFRDSLTFLDKWASAFDAGPAAALSNLLGRERTDIPEGWEYDPKQWEHPHYSADELEDIRDAAYSPDELRYTTDRIEFRRHAQRVKGNQGAWGSFGYDLMSGFTDPANLAVGFGTASLVRSAGVGSAALFQSGRVAAGLGSAVTENVVGSFATSGVIVAAGEQRTIGDFLTDAAFSAALGTAFSVPGARGASVIRDKSILDLSASNAAAFGEQWNADLRAKAVAAVGDSNPVALNNKVHQLAREEVKDWIRAGMADIPDDFRLFARPDVDAAPVAVAGQAPDGMAATTPNVNPKTGLFSIVGTDTPGTADLGLKAAWRAARKSGGGVDDVLRHLETNLSYDPDYRAIANALKRSGIVKDVKIEPETIISRWFPGEKGVVGGYHSGSHSLALKGSGYNPEFALHEILHAATVKQWEAGGEFRTQMDDLLKHVNDNISEADVAKLTSSMESRIAQGSGGFLTNGKELISYGLTNRDVQAVLRNIPAPPGAAQKSAWEWLKAQVARVLGLDGKENALERLMSIVGDELGVEVQSPTARSAPARSLLANSIFKSNRERKAFYQRSGLDTGIADDATRVQIAEVMGRAERFSGAYGIDAKKLATVMQRVDLEATSTTLMSSKSSVARMLSITLLENPEGAAGRHSTAAIARRGLFETYMGSRPRQWEAAYRLWRAQVRGAGALKDFAGGWKMRTEFEYAVKLYRETRYMGGDIPDAHPSVKQMAASIDEGYNRMSFDQRAVGTVGSARLPTEAIEGYETRTWLGGAIAAAGRTRREAIRLAMKEQFGNIGELYGDKFLDKFATKYLERIQERAAGINRAPDNLYSDNHADTLRDTLRALSLNEEQIQKVMGRYSRGGAKHTKARIELDVTKKYGDVDGEFRLMDYLDNRVIDNYRKYAGRVSGDVALAKHGVLGDAGISVMRKAMQFTGANDKELRAFDQVMSEFTGRVIGTGDPTVLANARLLTTAIQLGGSGINQAAEYSNGLPVVGAAGVAEAIRIGPRMMTEIRKLLSGQDPENSILSGFEFISGRGFGLAGYDLHLFNSVDTQASMYGSERAGFLSQLSQQTANANRILSGQRATLAVQQRGFAEVLIAKGVKFLRDGEDADIALKDMGLDDVLLARLRETQDQVVRWGADGKLEAVDPRNVDNLIDRQAWLAFYTAIERGTSQILQEAYIGETGKWAHSGLLKTLFQHRTFSLTAQQKQLGRNVGLYGAWKTSGIIIASMGVVAPLQAMRVASRVALLPEDERDAALEESVLSPLALGRSTLNYISSVGMLSDVLDVGTGVAGGWYEHMADTDAPNWLRSLSGGPFGNRKEVVGGQFAPALGVVNDFAQGIQGKPDNLADVLPGGRLPYVIPLLKGAAAQFEEQ